MSKTQYANDLQGTGSKLFGGRWNHIDSSCIYTSESRALAVLEYAVNVNIDFIPRALSLCIFEIDEEQTFKMKEDDLPGNWRNMPALRSTKDYGTGLLQKRHPIIRIPSVIIPQEFNYLINPLGEAVDYRLVEIKDFVFDLRIKSS